MLGPLDSNNLTEHLTAFADGELGSAQASELWAYLAEHPERDAAIRWIRDQQRLTVAARRLAAGSAPDDLRNRIAGLIESQPRVAPAIQGVQAKSSDSPRRAWSRRLWYPFAVAAGLFIGIGLTATWMRPNPKLGVVPGELIVTVARIHAECSRLPEALHKATFEATDARLAATIAADLGAGVPTPDLTNAGFRFVGAGPCSASGVGTVHLLYRSAKPSSPAAVSVFVQPDTGQFAHMEAGRVYRVSSTTSPFPTLAWRSGKAIYFLLADDDRSAAAVLKLMRPKGDEPIVSVASR